MSARVGVATRKAERAREAAIEFFMGRPLPGDLRYYDLPRDLLMRLPPPPAGHRYVRVAADILLIAIGSSMVLDAVEDLVR